MKFKVKIGTHVEASGKSYATGEIVETHSDLIKSFGPEKFQLVESVAKAGKGSDTNASENAENADKGEDVTDKFTSAEDAGVTVFKNGKNYGIFDEQEELLNYDVELTSQAKVNDYITTLIEK